ncbi:DUF2935 domain-containing protein [Halalkalibacterium ligniniphilum]|uniref:DUF2935 domain-containing protein n=1 Tax=Halalkalibacterium ligniniphilum TaxID=1134413 RepID=UPI0003652F43|nr:DUF2935 domain-containing protein [Halalkalibacterium ligniniphilum]
MYEESALFEHRFWLQVLGDHMRFIHTTLAPTEVNQIKEVTTFIISLDTLLSESRESLSGQQLLQLTEKAHEQAKTVRSYKLSVIKKQLFGEIQIGLSPTFLNHMVNEVEEYLRILPFLENEQLPPKNHPLHHHLVWLLDAAAHAGGIAGFIDLTEKQVKEKLQHFTIEFKQFYLKAVEMAGYLRANITYFPALDRFNEDTKLEMTLFQNFLQELEEMKMTNRLLGPLSPLMADHMFREECYYLMKLAQVTSLNPPDCDPTKPRVQTD